MVAVFWDDLKTTNSGRVYTWYDEINKLFIVQWSRVRTFQNNTSETFQVILRDPMYYTTPTGDGEILIQYLDFNNNTTEAIAGVRFMEIIVPLALKITQ